MPLSNTSQNSTFAKLKINKETDTPVFYKVEKKGDQWVETQSFNKAEGFLKGIKVETYTWENKEKMSMKITLQEQSSDEQIIITAGFNNATRSMLNSIAGCEKIGLLELKCAKWGKGEKKYPTIFVSNNGQKTAWKYRMDEIPEIEKVTNKKGEVVSFDDTDINIFFKNLINIDINTKIVNEFEAISETKTQSESTDQPKVDTGLPWD